MEANDKALSEFQGKFAAHYGAGAVPWAAIIQALLAMLGGGCIPTEANIKSQIKRPLVRFRLYVKMSQAGVPTNRLSQATDAAVKTLEDATDEELTSYIKAAQEGE